MLANRKYQGIFFTIVFIVFLSWNSPAQEILNWQECLIEAKKNNPDLISGQAQLNQAKADKKITQSSGLPQISSSLSQNTSKSSGNDQQDSYQYGISLDQLVFDAGKTKNNIKASEQDIVARQATYNAISASVRNELRSAYIQLLKAQELIVITREIVRRREQNVQLVQLRYEAGREHRGSLLTEEANLEQARFEVLQAERNLTLAQRRLIKALGREKFSPITVYGDLSTIVARDEKPILESIVDQVPSVKEQQAVLVRSQFLLNASKADFFPEIFLGTGAGKFGNKWAPKNDEWSAGVTVSLPIFEGGRQKAQVTRSQEVLVQANADLKSEKDNTILSLEEEWKDWQDALGNVTVRRKFLDATEERSKIAESQYSTGLLAFDDWTIIEDDLVRSKKSYLDAQEQALIAESNWILVQGGTLENEI